MRSPTSIVGTISLLPAWRFSAEVSAEADAMSLEASRGVGFHPPLFFLIFFKNLINLRQMPQSEFKINNILIPEELPLIALKNTVLFSKAVIPLIVQRPKSVSALEYAHSTSRLVFFATQKSVEDDVTKRDIFTTGTIGRIISVLKLPDGSSKVDVEGLVRARIMEVTSEAPFFRVRFAPFLLTVRDNLEEKALLRKAIEQFRLVSETRTFSI